MSSALAKSNERRPQRSTHVWVFLDGDVDLLGEGDGGAHAVGQDEGLILLAVDLEEVAADLADLCKKWGERRYFAFLTFQATWR